MKSVRNVAAVVLFAALTSAASAAPEDVTIIEPATLTGDRYEIVTRLWVESWRSAFQIPGHADQAAAISELKAEAARLGAHALTNLTCLVDDKPLWTGAHFCYALAIRVK